MKGVFVSVSDNDLGAYAIRLDAQYQELGREKLAAAPGRGGRGPGAPGGRGPAGPADGGRGMYPVLDLPAGFNLPHLLRPAGSWHPGEWNEFEVLLFGSTVKPAYNGGALGGGGQSTAPDDAGKYGPIAIDVSGSGEARFKDLRYKDLQILETYPPEQVSRNSACRI